jgi:alpha-tubulin suppressor-like RCC1 family protein
MNTHDHHDHLSGLAWGYNNAGALGVGGTATMLRPAPVHLPTHTIDVQGGSDFTIALTAEGRVYAWGGNVWGQLGRTPARVRFTPELVAIPGHAKITAISAGQDHVLALTEAGRVCAWGRNTFGQLGDGTREHRHTPQLLPLRNIAAVSTGNTSSAAVTTTGSVYTWGHAEALATAEVAAAAELFIAAPRKLILPKGVRAVAAAAGQRHLVLLTDRGQLLGYGLTPGGKPVARRLPVDASHGRVVSISAGDNHTVALTRGGAVLTWGANEHGQLGHGSPTGISQPSHVRIPKQRGQVVQVIAGGGSVLARTDTHHVYSWGQGRWGQHGTGTTDNATRPVHVPIPDGHQVRGLYAGRYHCFATTH